MKVEFHGVDDSNGPIGVFLTAESTAQVELLAMLQEAVGNTPPIFSCLSDDVSKGFDKRVINGVLDIFPQEKPQ